MKALHMRRHRHPLQVIATAITLTVFIGVNGSVFAAESKNKRSPVAQPAPQPAEDLADPRLSDSVNAERALASKPNERVAHLKAAHAHLAEGAESASHIATAQEHAQAVLKDHPNDLAALLILGQTSLLKKDTSAAARYYRAATLVDANNASAFLGLGDALTRLGDEPGSDMAFARYRVLMGMAPSGKSAQK